MTEKSNRETIELVNPKYQPSKTELEEDVRVNASPEEVAKAVMQRVDVRHIRRPKARSVSGFGLFGI